jgi:RNA polymerase sigma-70 factor (ECF subfamily)
VDVSAVSATAGAATLGPLVRAAVGGDADAFRRLVEPHLETALRASTLMTGSEAEGSDVVQDALLAAWRTLGKLHEPDAFGGWFRTIVLRTALRHARARRRIVALDLEAAAPTGLLDRSVETRELARAFSTLTAEDRAALTLRHLWGASTAEAARMLGIPEGTVKSRTFHALERLRAAYAAEERR